VTTITTQTDYLVITKHRLTYTTNFQSTEYHNFPKRIF